MRFRDKKPRRAARSGRRLRLAAFATATTLAIVEASAQAETLASPTILAGLFVPRNTTCYLSNVGPRPVRVEGLRIVDGAGETTGSGGSCGPLAGFALAPGKTCWIGSSNFDLDSESAYRCQASVADASALRGAIELRDKDGNVLRSLTLTSGKGGTSATEYRLIASQPIFGGQNQNAATCRFTNIGTTPVRVRNMQIVRSNQTAPASSHSCPEGSADMVVPPGETCSFGSNALGAATDLYCRAEVNRPANVRAELLIFGNFDMLATGQLR